MNKMNLISSFGNPARQITIAYFAAFITLGMTSASLGPTLDALSIQTFAGLEKISWLFPIRSFGYLLGAVLAGRLYDRLQGHRLMALALVLMAGTMILIPTLPFFAVLMAALLAAGLGEGMLDVGGNTLIVWLHGKRVGPYMNALHFFFGFGALLAPLIVGQVVLRTESITWAYWLIAIATIPALTGVLITRSPVNNTAGSENGKNSAAPPGQALLILLVLFFFFYVAAEISFGGWVYLYAVKAAKTPAATAAYITSGFWGAFTFGRLVGIPLSAKLTPARILQIDLAGALLSLGLILTWPFETWALWAGSLGFGFFIASIFPTMITYAGTRMTVTGRITGYFFFGATIGGMVLPWGIGQFFEKIGPPVMTWSIAGAVFLAIITGISIALLFKNRQALHT